MDNIDYGNSTEFRTRNQVNKKGMEMYNRGECKVFNVIYLKHY